MSTVGSANVTPPPHTGQLDRGDAPYMLHPLHPLHVMLQIRSDDARIVAVLRR